MNNIARDLGEQPIVRIMATDGLSPHAIRSRLNQTDDAQDDIARGQGQKIDAPGAIKNLERLK